MYRLGLVTYQIGKDWDLETLLDHCQQTGFEGVELRTSHAHGVEVELDADARARVKARFADSDPAAFRDPSPCRSGTSPVPVCTSSSSLRAT